MCVIVRYHTVLLNPYDCYYLCRWIGWAQLLAKPKMAGMPIWEDTPNAYSFYTENRNADLFYNIPESLGY
jgi:hypothetical protein